jgi:glucose dehydrogenase
MATNDARLLAVDAATGKPCDDFGESGTARQDPSIPTLYDGEYQITSAPTISGDAVIVGLAMAGTLCTCSPGSRITAFGARSGSVVWRWYPIPPAAADATWDNGSWAETGCGEMWSVGAVDRGARPPNSSLCGTPP